MKQADSLREETIKAHVMGLPSFHHLKRSALVKNEPRESATNSCYGNNKQVMFLKLRPGLVFMLELSKTVPLLAALKFTVSTENNWM